jgi:hypothetical protein
MQARQPVTWHGEHLERIVVAQVGLYRERKAGEVTQGFQIVGVDARRVKTVLVEGHVVVGMAQRPFQALQLQCADLVPAGDFDGVEGTAVGGQVFHRGVLSMASSSPPSSKCLPLTVRDRPRNSAIVRPSAPVTVTS